MKAIKINWRFHGVTMMPLEMVPFQNLSLSSSSTSR
jgi:hypothetical protein